MPFAYRLASWVLAGADGRMMVDIDFRIARARDSHACRPTAPLSALRPAASAARPSARPSPFAPVRNRHARDDAMLDSREVPFGGTRHGPGDRRVDRICIEMRSIWE